LVNSLSFFSSLSSSLPLCHTFPSPFFSSPPTGGEAGELLVDVHFPRQNHLPDRRDHGAQWPAARVERGVSRCCGMMDGCNGRVGAVVMMMDGGNGYVWVM